MSYKNITANEFSTMMNDENTLILDVRTMGEVNEGIIPNAIHIDIMGGDFASKVEELDKSKRYLVYCRSGNRSGSACGFMKSKGFNEVYNLSGGIMYWSGKVV